MSKLLELMIAECNEQVQKELYMKGFELRPPFVQMLSSDRFILWITETDGVVRTQEFSAAEVDSVVSKKETYGPEVDRLVQNWYPGSKYCVLREIAKIKHARWRTKDPNKKMELRQKQQELEEKSDSPEVLKNDLHFAYNESGGRLEKLYKIFYGDQVVAEFPMGVFTVNIPIRHFQPEMAASRYGESRGFFADLANAYALIESLDGPVTVGLLSRKFGKDISANATGTDVAQIKSMYASEDRYSLITIEGIVSRKEQWGCMLQSRIEAWPIDMTTDEFSTTMTIHYPEAWTYRAGKHSLRFNVGGLRGRFYGKEKLLELLALPQILEERTIPFLETIIPNQ